MFHTCAIITGQKTSNVIAVGMACWPNMPTPRIHRGPVRYRLYLYVKRRLHADYGLEGPSLADAHLRPPGGDVRLGYLEVLALEVAHHVLGDGSDVLNKVGEGLGRV